VPILAIFTHTFNQFNNVFMWQTCD